jgi:hypothetical protein
MRKKEKIVKLFLKYCSKCNGQCCKRGFFSVFGWEMDKLASEYENFYVGKISEERGTAKDIAINEKCMFSGGNGCNMPVKHRPVDCLTFPFYPKLKDNNKELSIDFFVIHKECSYYEKIAKDKNLLRSVTVYWSSMIKKLTRQEIIDWIGEDGRWNEWYKNTVAVTCNKNG